MNYFQLFAQSAATHPECLAIVDDAREFTYAQMMRESSRTAAWLRQLGLRSGDSLIVFAANRAEHIFLHLACAQIGVVFTPVHASFRAREVGYVLQSSRPKVAFVDAATIDILTEAIQQSDVSPKLVSFDPLLERPEVGSFLDGFPEQQQVTSEDLPSGTPLTILYTSGTTSMPKPVLRSHGADTWSVQNYVRGWNFEAGDRVYVPLSLAWAWGLTVMSMSALASGATLFLDKSFNPVRALAAIEKHRITTFAGSMSMYGMLLDVLQREQFQTSSLKKMFVGGEPRNEAMVAAAEAHFGQRLYEGYALSECFPHLVTSPEHDVNAPVGSLGRRVAPEAQIKLVDPNGVEVGRGEVGQALIKSPGCMTEYLNEPDMTAERLTPEGWLRTGDLLREDENGYFFFAGRSTDMIVRGGANISPLEIEAALLEHPTVKDVAVVGIPDPVKGEQIVALTVLRENEIVSEQTLLAFLEGALARYKVPQRLIILEDIPVAASGKRSRKALRELAIQILQKTEARKHAD
ncbi:class I adenylate-forming enzyme family protein [Microvirga zambiensis]|uniref:class I adenylate-forming enzyme family protein n=1 Tax=Microvirga zambiensis TaxID=1402137 RepID=UPI00191EA5B8|nr:class I adenylate-forming enzyme family protein [Microvirga zambiensis]